MLVCVEWMECKNDKKFFNCLCGRSWTFIFYFLNIGMCMHHFKNDWWSINFSSLFEAVNASLNYTMLWLQYYYLHIIKSYLSLIHLYLQTFFFFTRLVLNLIWYIIFLKNQNWKVIFKNNKNYFISFFEIRMFKKMVFFPIWLYYKNIKEKSNTIQIS